MKTRLPVGTLVLFLAWLAVLVVVTLLVRGGDPAPGPVPGTAAPAVHYGTTLEPFTLSDHRGRAFSRADLAGTWSFVLFGYTRCRHDCPAALTELAYMLRDLPDAAARDARVLFVTLDPAHDEPAVLARYLSHFPGRFIGLTGEPPALRALAAQFGIHWDGPGAAAQAPRLDPRVVFLVDPRATLVASYPPPHDRDELAGLYLQLRAGASSS
jgi:cytochrome oxidase Cu insertion factor (SCO1/SenC/PrrC family)